jgi:DNA polymerase-3 subunit beta
VAEQELEPGKTAEAAQDIKVIVPKKAALEIRRLLEEGGDEPMIGFTKNMLIFRKSRLVLTSRLMEGNYPNYQQVMPKESSKFISVNREEFEGALRRVSVLSRDKTYAVKLTFGSEHIKLFSSIRTWGRPRKKFRPCLTARNFPLGLMLDIFWTY